VVAFGCGAKYVFLLVTMVFAAKISASVLFPYLYFGRSKTSAATTMKFEYQGLDGKTCTVELEEIEAKDIVLHSTPDENVASIREVGLKTKMPRTKLMVDVDAIFCTIPSPSPNTRDLFRYYEDWSIIVIDTSLLPDHKWYIDFLADEDMSNNGQNKHIMTFQDIPPEAITKVLK
jgi:hypothetical protein